MNARTEMEAFMETEVAHLRIPPNSMEAEQAVLGALLLSNEGWDHVGDTVATEDFYRYENRLVFDAISALVNAGRPADVITVYEHLKGQAKADEVGGLAYLNSLAQYVPSAANLRRHAQLVRERSLQRKVISASDEMATLAFQQAMGADELMEHASTMLLKLTEGVVHDDWLSTDSAVIRFLDRVQEAADGTHPDFTPTGLRALDDRLDGGMRPGELIVIGARPSMGKSALGLSIAAHVSVNEGKNVGIFSMEMPADQVTNRLMALQAGIHLTRLKRPERLRDFDWPLITQGVEILRQSRLYISDRSNLNINQLRALARGLQRRHGQLGCLVVDYLGLMSGTDPKAPRVYQLEEVTKGLKALAKELQTTVLLLCQVKRGVEERSDQMPMLSDLRDSGSIEQDADIVMFVHREYKAKPQLGDEWKYHARVSVAKSRDGEVGFFDLMYVGENTRFKDWPEDQPLPVSKVMTKRGGDL